MRVIRTSSGEEILSGTDLGDGVTYQGILVGPSPTGNAGGPFAGRITVVDAEGTVHEPFPFHYGLAIVP